MASHFLFFLCIAVAVVLAVVTAVVTAVVVAVVVANGATIDIPSNHNILPTRLDVPYVFT